MSSNPLGLRNMIVSAVPPLPDHAKPQPVPGDCAYCKGRGVREPVSCVPGRPWMNRMTTCPFCDGTGRA